MALLPCRMRWSRVSWTSQPRITRNRPGLPCQPDFAGSVALRPADNVWGNDDQQFVVFHGLVVVHYRLVDQGNGAESRDSVHAHLVSVTYGSGHHGRFAVRQDDASLIFAIGDYRHSVDRLRSNGAQGQFQRKSKVGVRKNRRLCFQIKADVFVAEGRKWSPQRTGARDL